MYLLNGREIKIQVNEIQLTGDLNIPGQTKGIIVFSHGSGSSRFSTRNRHVAAVLNGHNMATLLTDLLTEEEDRTFENRFNIELITTRLVAVIRHTLKITELVNLPLGCFGASTGAA